MPIENVILTTDNCRYCLMCRHVGSIELITHKETHTPHGWALIIASVRRGLLQWDPETVDILFTSPDHGNSRAHCVSDQPLPEAIAAMRAEVVRMKLAPPVVYEIDQAFHQWGTPFAHQLPETLDSKGENAIFVGDEARYLWPQALNGALELLKACGVVPVQIGVGRSNGYLASSLGLQETATSLARENLEELKSSSAKRLFVLGPGDYFAFRQMYDERLGLPLPGDVELVEVLSFVNTQIQNGSLHLHKLSEQAPYAYIDPTHAVRIPTRHDSPRALLAAVMTSKPHELFWRRERTHPAGNTALQFTKPDIATQLTLRRLEDARQNGAQLVFTEDPGTLHVLNQQAEGCGLRLVGLYELLAGALNKDVSALPITMDRADL